MLKLFLIIFLQLKGMEFISCIQEKYTLSPTLNFAFNSFHDLKFPKPSSKLSNQKRTVDKRAHYQFRNVYCTITKLTECKMKPQNYIQSKCSNLLFSICLQNSRKLSTKLKERFGWKWKLLPKYLFIRNNGIIFNSWWFSSHNFKHCKLIIIAFNLTFLDCVFQTYCRVSCLILVCELKGLNRILSTF